MLKSYKYRLLPTEEQKRWFTGLFGSCRFVYNLALETKANAWQSAQRNITPYDLVTQLKELKDSECTWLKQYPYQCLASVIVENLGNAYSRFFKGSGFPKFKRKSGRQSVIFRQDARVENRKIKLTKIGFVDFVEHRKLPDGEIRTVVVSREPSGNYFVSILLKDTKVIPNKSAISEETTVGVDVGLKTFATLSNGEIFENPKHLGGFLKRLRIEQRKLSRRRKRGAKIQSKSYEKQKLIVARLHETIANKRKDFLHKTSSAIIKQFDTVCLEDLNIRGMLKNASLAKAVSDVSWYEFGRLLEYKAQWYGKNIVRIGRFDPSSKTCSDCGHLFKELTLSDREWDCQNCGSHHDRDENAAKNIKIFGLETKPSTAKASHEAVLMGCESMSPNTSRNKKSPITPFI